MFLFSISLYLNSDEVWRPGAMDQDGAQAAENSGMWGADESNEQTTFGSPANDGDDVWGSSQGNTWAAATEKAEPMDDNGNLSAVVGRQPQAGGEVHFGGGSGAVIKPVHKSPRRLHS